VATKLPETRVRAIIDAQIAAGAIEQEAARNEALHAMFSDDAVVLGMSGATSASALSGDVFEHERITTLESDGNAAAVWFVAGLEDTTPPASRNPGSSASWRPVRYAGVAARSQGWKVVAGSLVYGFVAVRGSGTLGQEPIARGTPASALTRLVLDGAALSAATTSRTIVVGTEESAIARGPQALGAWASRTLVLDPDSRELLESRWGAVQANVAFPGGNVGVFAVGIPSTLGTWTPVLVQYISR
jgi:hypothetical protein